MDRRESLKFIGTALIGGAFSAQSLTQEKNNEKCKISEHKLAKEIVANFCKSDFNGDRLTQKKAQQALSLCDISHNDMYWETIRVVDSYEIKAIRQKINTNNNYIVSVEFGALAELNQESLRVLNRRKVKIEQGVFSVVVNNGIAKIVEIPPTSYVSLNATKSHVRNLMDSEAHWIKSYHALRTI